MDKIKVIHYEAGETLTVWFDDPQKEHICEETRDEVVLMKEVEGRLIGFEMLHYKPILDRKGLSVETIIVPSE